MSFDVLSELVVEKGVPDARQRLLTAAETVFAEKGFDAASIREISAEAGVNLASIKYYFGDKEGLYIEAVKFAHTCALAHGPLPEFPVGLSAVAKLEMFIRGMVARMHGPARPSSMKLMMREMAHPGKAAHVVVEEFIQPMAFRLRAILRELLPGLPEQRILMFGFSVIGQILYYRQNRPVSELIFDKPQVDALSEAMVAEHIVRFTLAALGHAEPIRPEGTP
jgi:AcrR family transcriptional regulator